MRPDGSAAGREEGGSRRRGLGNAFKLATLGAAAVGSLVVLELGLRYRAHVQNAVTLEAAFTVPEALPDAGFTRTIDIIRPHPNDRIIFDLRPNLDVEFKGARLTTNSHGFRGPEYPVEPEPGMLTIVGIGGSIMLGHGVADGEEFPVPLLAALRERYPARTWRFVNTSVVSHNVVMKVEMLEVKGLRFRPDLVILEIASNNLALPNYIRVQEDPLDLRRSFLAGLIHELRAKRDETREFHAVLGQVDGSKLSWSSPVQTDRSRIPPEYRGLIGWEPFYQAFDRLAELSRAHGFEVVVFAHLRYGVVVHMLEEAKKRGFHTVSTADDVVAYLQEHDPQNLSVEGFTRSALVVSPNNLHPSALLHRMSADRLLADMERLGVIERLLARP